MSGLGLSGLEIDMVVKDSLAALELYESVFEVERIEVGDFIVGQNEVILKIHGTRFHLLDENEQFELFAPKPNDRLPIWFNIIVSDINKSFDNAVANGFSVIQPLTEMPEMGIKNAMLVDTFGYVWLLHQIDKEVSFEERTRMFEEQGFERRK